MGNTKNTINTQFGRVSLPSGNRGNTSTGVQPVADPNEGLEPLLDNQGRLIVRISDENGFVGSSFDTLTFPDPVVTGYDIPVNGISFGTDRQRIVAITAWNGALTRVFLQFFNFNSTLPVVGSNPVASVPIESGAFLDSTFCDWISAGSRQFSGLAIIASTTQFTLTKLATAQVMVYFDRFVFG